MRVVGFLEPVNPGDVRMTQRGEQARFATETSEAVRVPRELRVAEP